MALRRPRRAGLGLGDRSRLRQVLLNLLTNAVKFTDAGSISLTARTVDGHVTVDVTDTGIGVPAEDQERVFEEFQRSHRAAARSRGGLGLGLAIAKQLVELHGGSIELHASGAGGRHHRVVLAADDDRDPVARRVRGTRPRRSRVGGPRWQPTS